MCLNSTNWFVTTDLFVWPVFNSFRADADRFVRVLINVIVLLSKQISAVSSQTTWPYNVCGAIVWMGLDVTDKLLCYFAMALVNDGITHQTIKSYLSAVHWPGSRIQRVPRSCGTSKGTRPLCLLLGALYDWAVPSHHTPKHGATMLTTIPGARPMIDNSGRRLTTINNTMSCLHVVMMMTSFFTCVKIFCCYGYWMTSCCFSCAVWVIASEKRNGIGLCWETCW